MMLRWSLGFIKKKARILRARSETVVLVKSRNERDVSPWGEDGEDK